MNINLPKTATNLSSHNTCVFIRFISLLLYVSSSPLSMFFHPHIIFLSFDQGVVLPGANMWWETNLSRAPAFSKPTLSLVSPPFSSSSDPLQWGLIGVGEVTGGLLCSIES